MDNKLAQKEILRDLRLKLAQAEMDGYIIPKMVVDIITELEKEYGLAD